MEIFVPEIDVYIIDGLIDLAFITPHEIKLVNNSQFHHPVFPNVALCHGSEFIDFDYISWTEAVWVEDNAIISVHSSLDTCEELVSEIEIKQHGLIINQVWDMSEIVLVWLFVFIQSLPILCILSELIAAVLGRSVSNQYG